MALSRELSIDIYYLEHRRYASPYPGQRLGVVAAIEHYNVECVG
ncbi:MAG: hypothetical protein RBR02_02115 [Desulfuromonadaceae bacterium]|nr:hypothetical protein [Desulfuromonadaceae bacterium]